MSRQSRKIALVTGSTGGLGTAICKKLATNEYRVVANYRNYQKADTWKNCMEAEGFAVDIFEGDVSDFDSVARMIKKIELEVGHIDVLINNAGITKDIRLCKMGKDDWDKVISTNLTGVFNCTRHVINGMMERKYGRIINISSVNAQRGQFGQTNYSAAKAGMHGFTKTLAMEVAKYGITVNTISPGYLATEMVMAVPDDIKEKIVQQVPVGRLGGPEEIAEAVAFIADANNSFITGANISINGGLHVY